MVPVFSPLEVFDLYKEILMSSCVFSLRSP